MTDKQCSSCDTNFVCSANDTDTPCWCAELPAIIPVDFFRDCQCPACLKHSIMAHIHQTMAKLDPGAKIALAAPYADQGALVEDIDFTLENGNYVFSAWYHLKRGSCCGSGCRNCPYKQLD